MSRSAVALATIAGVFVLSLMMLVFIFSFGWLDINWPWEDVDLVKQESDVAVNVEEAGPAEIIKIAPLALDCRARITADVPVIGRQQTKVVGATVSTDTVRLRAIGDVDTCVEADGVDIADRNDGTVDVIIQAESIRFVRPRVDAIATMASVETDRGFVNQVVEALPWTNEDDELTAAAFAFAQSVIGSSECMQAAYDETAAALVVAYEEQYVEQGGDAADIEVIISGVPDFGQNDIDPGTLGEFEFEKEPGTTCIVRS